MDYTENIRRTKEYIAKHLLEDLTAEEIAAHAGYSTYHYCRIFKENTGKSLMRYVREKRLEAAEKDIKSGESTADVAQKCGFETTSGFSRAYKRKFGKRPTKKKNA
ncbi:MAG: helix-turn-helix transcriptional regulator [Oscillospiraceae bacterium]|nr:helix-turn-helix transcriptional regulator [Oscillospiraceae bacterium]